MLIDQLLYLEYRYTHLDAQIFHFFTASHYTAIIVAEYHDGFTDQIRSEDAFTGYVKVIAIDQSDECFHVFFGIRFQATTDIALWGLKVGAEVLYPYFFRLD